MYEVFENDIVPIMLKIQGVVGILIVLISISCGVIAVVRKKKGKLKETGMSLLVGILIFLSSDFMKFVKDFNPFTGNSPGNVVTIPTSGFLFIIVVLILSNKSLKKD